MGGSEFENLLAALPGMEEKKWAGKFLRKVSIEFTTMQNRHVFNLITLHLDSYTVLSGVAFHRFYVGDHLN